jgi:prepilin-type N-terminal cleavage/methylation domain-containing protein
MARDSGFTLTEVLCAVIVFGVAVVGITEALTHALRSTKEAERHTIAAQLATGRLELLRAEGYLQEGDEEDDFAGAPGAYRFRQSVRELERAGLFDVRVEVYAKGSARALYELSTRLFEMPYESSSTAGDRDSRRRRAARDPTRARGAE